MPEITKTPKTRVIHWFDPTAESKYDNQVVPCAFGVLPLTWSLSEVVHAPHMLPPRSMVGQLTLDQHIGVRIPGGQPF